MPIVMACMSMAKKYGGAEIKAMADLVTDSVSQDGLYKAFEKLELI